MTSDIDRLSRNRIWIVACLAVSYALSQLVSLSFVSGWTGWSETLLTRLENIGLLIFLLALAALGLVARKTTRLGDTAKAALFDELVLHNAKRAMQFGYKILFLFALILFVLNQDFMDLGFAMTGEDVARIMVTSALVIPYLRFAFLEARNA